MSEPGAIYVHLDEQPRQVARSVSVSDLVIVDLDASGQPIGVDFAIPYRMITRDMLDRLATRFPAFGTVAEDFLARIARLEP